jgi:hypothetical protein
MTVTPSGYMTSREMFDRIGRDRHPAAWTGEIEYSARQGLTTVEQYDIDCNTPGSGMTGSGMRPIGAVYHGSGSAVKVSAADTEAQWAARRAKTRAEIESETYQAERIARLRYDDVFNEFLRRLESGDVKAFALDRETGKLWPIESQVWRTRHANRYLDKGVGPAGHYYRNREPVVREGALLIAATGANAPKPLKLEVMDNVTPMQRPRRGKRALAPLRRKGRPGNKTEMIADKMSKMDPDELANMSHKEMAHRFGAVESTCKIARDLARSRKPD